MDSIITKGTFHDLNERYEALTASVHAICELSTPIVGGQPARADGVRNYVTHHLKLTAEQEIAAAIQRIMHEEVGERDMTPELGEITEKASYGLNVLRRDEIGPWIGSWQVRACIKQAASRLKVFTQFRGAKGDFSEAAQARAAGISMLNPAQLERIYLIGPDGQPAQTEWHEFRGRVSTPQGAVSIIHTSECAPIGTRFEFTFNFLQNRVPVETVQDVLSMMMTAGLGSVRSLSYGSFRIVRYEIREQAKEMKDGFAK